MKHHTQAAATNRHLAQKLQSCIVLQAPIGCGLAKICVRERFESVIVSVIFAKFSSLGFPRCNCNQKVCDRNFDNFGELIRLGV